MSMTQPPQRLLPTQVEISNSIRKNLMDLARWLRSLVISYILDLGSQAAIEERLKGIASSADTQFSEYYGPELGNRLEQIYLDYFHTVHEIIHAYLDNDEEDILLYRDLMYKSADEISELLAGVNRYWDRATLQAMLYVLVYNTESQIANLVAGDYAQDIASYDEYVEQIYRIADEYTYGILKQFQV